MDKKQRQANAESGCRSGRVIAGGLPIRPPLVLVLASLDIHAHLPEIEAIRSTGTVADRPSKTS